MALLSPAVHGRGKISNITSTKIDLLTSPRFLRMMLLLFYEEETLKQRELHKMPEVACLESGGAAKCTQALRLQNRAKSPSAV